MHPGMAGTYLLPDVVGRAAARDLFLTGRIVEGDEALRLGLVSRVVEPEGLADAAVEAAAGIAAAAPVATRLTKLALQRGGHADIETGAAVGGDGAAGDAGDPDLQEGIAAVQEKRRPASAAPDRPGTQRGPRRAVARPRSPSPCERRPDPRGPLLASNLGGAGGAVNGWRAHLSTPVDNVVDDGVENARNRGDTPGRRRPPVHACGGLARRGR